MRRSAMPSAAVRRKRRVRITAIAAALLITVCWLEFSLRPTVEQNALLSARLAVTQLLCRAAEESMTEEGDAAYTTVLYDTNGAIAAVEVSAAAVNRLQNAMISRASALLHEEADTTIRVPLGAAGGMTLLSANGPSIRVRIRPHGAVVPELQSSFESAGMNQTLHRLMLVLMCEVELIAPFCSDTICVEYPCLIAETLLVGDLPDYLLAGAAQPSS